MFHTAGRCAFHAFSVLTGACNPFFFFFFFLAMLRPTHGFRYRKQLIEGIHTVRFIDSKPVLDTERNFDL